MGIRGLNTFIKKICPECISNNNISDYSGKKFIIDASILMYKFRHISNINESLKHNSHLIGFINRIKYYQKYDITPIFVFDGKPPLEKKTTLLKRQQNKNKIQEKIDLLNKLEISTVEEKEEIDKEIKKLTNQIIYVTKNHLDECKELLNLLNIKYYNAPDEAEKYCVFLYNNGIGDYIVSDDTDVFTFGGIKVLKTSIKNNIVETNLDLFLKKINYSFDKFIDFCILSGCDYLPYISSLAINTVFNLFKKYNNIEDIIKLNKYKITNEFNYEIVRKIFKEYNYDKPIYEENNNIINKFELKFFLEKYDIKNIIKILNKF